MKTVGCEKLVGSNPMYGATICRCNRIGIDTSLRSWVLEVRILSSTPRALTSFLVKGVIKTITDIIVNKRRLCRLWVKHVIGWL